MTSGKALCLNMIVKNEMANLERCLGAAAGHIACWVIGDTGSTDGTGAFIRSFFAERGIPGELHSFPFKNFEQARNEALARAAASPLGYDYLLFADADMELVVEDAEFRVRLEAPGYRMIQRSSALVYWNTRLARRDVGAHYHGVTHEYLDVPGGVETLERVWYRDHASGANRADKFERDIKLLREALKRDPENHRYWFYLAQSYRDAGRNKEAAEAYAKRAEMWGWDEEAWNARLQEGRCLRTLGDEGGFLRQALAAFNQRPQRAESLYDLARFYRERGMNEASVLFSEPGLALGRPKDDVLFIEDFIYTAGMQEEFSIAANYARDPARKDRGHAACNWLALSREVPQGSRELARSNLFFYAEPAGALMPSFEARPVAFTPPDGYRPLNPSVTRWGERIMLAQRSVNYTLTEDGRYLTSNEAPIHTRNFLLELDRELGVESATEILPPADWPAPVYPLVIGFEDPRLFAWQGGLWCISTVRELTAEGWCEQVLARLDGREGGECRLADWRALKRLQPHEKNWMPLVDGTRLRFVHMCDPTRVVDEAASIVFEAPAGIAAERLSGGSQAIAFDGGWLALVHDVGERDGKRDYGHRLVWFDDKCALRRVSRRFFFHLKGIEFAAGLDWHPDGERLLISYGVADCESRIAAVKAEEVRLVLENIANLRSGTPGSGDRAIGRPVARASAEPERRSASPAEPTGETNAGETTFDGIGPDSGERPMMPPPPPAAPTTPASIEPEAPPAVGASEPDGAAMSTEAQFFELAPFLRAVDSPTERLAASRRFDARIDRYLCIGDTTALPQIHCFYEVLSEAAEHRSLLAATASMRAAGHPVRVWSYSPEKLGFLSGLGVEVRSAADVVPRGLFKQIINASEIRYFSDIFRYAVLYEHGGLWMDSDVVLIRPFPFRGDYFLNLQWRGAHAGHFICGNAIFAKPYSRHFRNLYEMSVARFTEAHQTRFGEIGPRLLSDYVMSEDGAELREWLFSPAFFNPIDWTEVERFNEPIAALADYLHDPRVIGIHLWNARTNARSREEGSSLIAMLTNPLECFPSLADLADRFDTDKNRHTGNRHFYARVYDKLLSPHRLSLSKLMEIGLSRWSPSVTPSAALWQTYFPFCQVIGVDLTDFSALHNDRFASFICDQSQPGQLRSVAARIAPGSLDVIIDDGSHASLDEQVTFREFFPLLADGGWYFIEDLDWQPPGEDTTKITLTKRLFREIQQYGKACSPDPHEVAALSAQMSDILFFDSHYELERATLLGGLAAIRKRGGALNGG